jgi:hypothetical protein
MIGDPSLGKAAAQIPRYLAAAHDQMPQPQKPGFEEFGFHGGCPPQLL